MVSMKAATATAAAAATTTTTTTTINLMATSIGLLVVGAALMCSQAEASPLARTDGEHLLNPRPVSDTELSNESQVKSGASLMASQSSSSSGSPLATALLRSRRWAFLPSQQQQQQQQQPIAQQQQINSAPNEDITAHYTDAQLDSDEEAVQRILQRVLETYGRNKATQPQQWSAPAPAYYNNWLESKAAALEEVAPRSAHYRTPVDPSEQADSYPSTGQSFEKREHVKPCLFNAISCPKYPFRNRSYK